MSYQNVKEYKISGNGNFVVKFFLNWPHFIISKVVQGHYFSTVYFKFLYISQYYIDFQRKL